MAIQEGEKIPAGTIKHKTAEGIEDISTDQLFSGKKVVLFALPGAVPPLPPPRFGRKQGAELRDNGGGEHGGQQAQEALDHCEQMIDGWSRTMQGMGLA